MKHLRRFNESKEIKNAGFLDSDLLSTIVLDDVSKGSLYLFNHGSYGRIDKYLFEIKHEDDFVDIEDFLINLLSDYGYNFQSMDVINIEETTKSDVSELEVLKSYDTNEIGDMVIKINFKFSK